MLRVFQTRQPILDHGGVTPEQVSAMALTRRNMDADAWARIESAWSEFDAVRAPQAVPLHGSLPPLQPATDTAEAAHRHSAALRQLGVILGMGARWALILITVVALVFVGRIALKNISLPDIPLDWLRVALPLALLGGFVLVLLRIGRGLLGQLGLSLSGSADVDPFERFAAQLHEGGIPRQ